MHRTGRNTSSHASQRRGTKLCVRGTLLVLAIAIGSTLFAYAAFAPTHEKASTIEQLIFVFRHGDRTPTETYSKDPYLHYDWPEGWGALTKKGMLQMYNLGRWIRAKYGTTIGDTYENRRSYVWSSYADRCIMSAQALLAGLYPPSPDETFLPGLAWRPVPVHSIPRSLDKVIVVKAPCPRLEQALKEAYANDTVESGTRFIDYYRQLSLHTGQNITTITDVEYIYNTLEIEEQNGLKLPEWTKMFYNETMRNIAARSLAIFTSNALQRRLRGGPLLREIMQHLENRQSGRDQRTAYFYSAHDITLVNLLRTMGLVDETLKPDYGATVIFELHRLDDSQDRGVKVLYLDSAEAADTRPIEIPQCATPCRLSTLTNLWKNVLPQNWDDECRL